MPNFLKKIMQTSNLSVTVRLRLFIPANYSVSHLSKKQVYCFRWSWRPQWGLPYPSLGRGTKNKGLTYVYGLYGRHNSPYTLATNCHVFYSRYVHETRHVSKRARWEPFGVRSSTWPWTLTEHCLVRVPVTQMGRAGRSLPQQRFAAFLRADRKSSPHCYARA